MGIEIIFVGVDFEISPVVAITPVPVELAGISRAQSVPTIRASVQHSRTPNAHAVASAKGTGNSRFGDVINCSRKRPEV